MMPTTASRLQAITGFLPWRRAVERVLTDLDARLARTDAGLAGVWTGGVIPAGLVPADGSLLDRAAYPALFDAIGITYNTGGETGAQFRVPNFTTPPEHGVWVIRT